MGTQTVVRTSDFSKKEELSRANCIRIAISAALPAILAVLVMQALALSVWPEMAAFKPLDSYARSAIFTLIPAMIAVALFGRLYKSRPDPVSSFLKISGIVLLISFIPDFLLPLPGRTLLGSSVAAFLHLIAAIFIIGGILLTHRRLNAGK